MNIPSTSGLADYTILDLAGWQVYCPQCDAFREARRTQERNASDTTDHVEFVCNGCHWILLKLQRERLEEQMNKQHGSPSYLSRLLDAILNRRARP